MFIAHIIVGVACGAAASALMLVNGLPIWAAILCYSAGGSAGTLVSALIWFAVSEMVARRQKRASRARTRIFGAEA